MFRKTAFEIVGNACVEFAVFCLDHVNYPRFLFHIDFKIEGSLFFSRVFYEEYDRT